MGISINFSENLLQIKILNSPNWQKDLDKIKEIPNRKWDSGTKLWILPSNQMEDITTRWEKYEVIYSNKAEEYANSLEGKHKKLESLPPIVYPIDFIIPPKPYQEKFIRFHQSFKKIILALPTGAGKTNSALERIKIVGYKKLLVICPKVMKDGWQYWIRHLTGNDSLIYWGTIAQRKKQAEQLKNYNHIITTYEQAGELAEKLPFYDFDQIIIDESHLLADPTKQRFKSIKSLLDKVQINGLLLLTGTPIQHKPKNLWSLVYLVAPELAGSYQAWCDRYEQVVKSFRKEYTIKDKRGRLVLDYDGTPKTYVKEIPLITKTRNLGELRERLSSIMYRVAKEDIMDFEENIEICLVDLTGSQRRLYNQIRNEIIVELENKTLNMANAPVRMLRLLQAAEGEFNFNPELKDSTKLEYLDYEINNLEEDKLVIWSRFKPITAIIGERYKDRAVIYSGDMTESYKKLAIWAFNGVKDSIELEEFTRLASKNDFPFGPGEAKLFTSTIDIRSSLGFDLHQNCWQQIFTSFSFLGTANYQAASRLSRLGQKSGMVSTKYLVAKDTIEPSALNLIMGNFNTTLEILDGKDSASVKTTQQLIGLLRKEM